MIAAILSLAAVGSAIAGHSILCRRTSIPSLIAFLIAGTTCGLLLLAGMFFLHRSHDELIAALVTYAFVCELYLFAFTFATASISANSLALLKDGGVSVDRFHKLYTGIHMARVRLERSEQAGLIVRSEVIQITPAGHRLSTLFHFARRFFDHDDVAGRPWTAAIFLGSLVLFTFQIATVALNGWTLTGVCEESLGYRYFYALSAVYEPRRPLFLPQGQILDLFDRGLQVLLTALGYPPTQLFPRIDIFSYLSIFGMQIVNAACFAWMLQRARYIGAKLCIAVVLIAAAFSANFSFMYTFVQPDYMALALPILWLSIGAIFATLDGKPLNGARTLFFTVLLGFAASTKITLAAAPATALFHAVMSGGLSWRRSAAGLTAAFLAAALLGLAWLAVAQFSRLLLSNHVHQFLYFLATGAGVPAATRSFPAWYVDHLRNDQPAQIAIMLTPILAVIVAAVSRRLATISLILGAVSMFELYFLWSRDSPGTLMETAAPLLILLAVTLRHAFEHETKVRLAAPVLALVVVLTLGLPNVNGILPSIGQNTRDQATLPSPDGPERQLWLIPDNSVRPLSVHSSVMKATLDGSSGLRPIMFRNFDYRFYDWIKKPIDLKRYDSIFFIRNGGLDETIRRIETFYQIDLAPWHCEPSSALLDQTVIRCQLPANK
jgi:hypothetical protein